MLQQATGV